MSDETDALRAPRARTKTIELYEPINSNGQIFDALELRVPKIGEIQKAQTHLRGTADSQTRMIVVLVSLVTKIPEPVLAAQVDYDQLLEAGEFLMGFIPMPPTTSET